MCVKGETKFLPPETKEISGLKTRRIYRKINLMSRTQKTDRDRLCTAQIEHIKLQSLNHDRRIQIIYKNSTEVAFSI